MLVRRPTCYRATYTIKIVKLLRLLVKKSSLLVDRLLIEGITAYETIVLQRSDSQLSLQRPIKVIKLHLVMKNYLNGTT